MYYHALVSIEYAILLLVKLTYESQFYLTYLQLKYGFFIFIEVKS